MSIKFIDRIWCVDKTTLIIYNLIIFVLPSRLERKEKMSPIIILVGTQVLPECCQISIGVRRQIGLCILGSQMIPRDVKIIHFLFITRIGLVISIINLDTFDSKFNWVFDDCYKCIIDILDTTNIAMLVGCSTDMNLRTHILYLFIITFM